VFDKRRTVDSPEGATVSRPPRDGRVGLLPSVTVFLLPGNHLVYVVVLGGRYAKR